jgi:hypothetical protein
VPGIRSQPTRLRIRTDDQVVDEFTCFETLPARPGSVPHVAEEEGPNDQKFNMPAYMPATPAGYAFMDKWLNTLGVGSKRLK